MAKKIILALLSFLMVLSSSSVFANDSENSKNAQTIEYISKSDDELEVTYVLKNDEGTFKIHEIASEDYKEICSDILVLNDDGIYVEYSSQYFKIENGVAKYVITYPDSIKSEVGTIEIQDNCKPGSFISAVSSLSKGKSSGWISDGYVDSSTNVFKKTLQFIKSEIIEVAKFKASSIKEYAVLQVINYIAETIIEHAIPTMYHRQYYYEKHSLDVSWYMVTGSKWVTYFYEDSAHKKLIDSTTEIEYLDGYEE